MKMTTSSTHDLETSVYGDLPFNEITDDMVHLMDLPSDPDYLSLLEYYQHAEFAECKALLDQLEERYPADPRLISFKDDLQMKFSLKSVAESIKKEEKRKKTKATFNLTAFAVIATFIVTLVFFLSYFYFNEIVTDKQSEITTSQLSTLYHQADQLLLIGKPQPAAEIVEKISAINPQFENLTELATRTSELLRLEAKYQSGINLVDENRNLEALAVLREVEDERPGLWDVSHQISLIESSNSVIDYIDEGNAAYQVEQWDQAISAYENALSLDPSLDDPVMKAQLIEAYLNKVIILLQDENTSFEAIDSAEQYYIRAKALNPEDQVLHSEKSENLQKASIDLLSSKFAQLAKSRLADKNQTASSISEAVLYMRKASKISPENTSIQAALTNSERYYNGFQNFIEMNWGQAITNLSQVLSGDSEYAQENARLLLFEAHYAQGKELYSAGNYQEALNNLDMAETMAQEGGDNLMKLFQVQVALGDTYGAIDDFQNAVSYYQRTLIAIQASRLLTNYPDVAAKIEQAEDLTADENYESAFEAYQEALLEIAVFYTIKEVEISGGFCLALFAAEHLSTIDAVLEANELPKNMVIADGRKLNVPTIEN